MLYPTQISFYGFYSIIKIVTNTAIVYYIYFIFYLESRRGCSAGGANLKQKLRTQRVRSFCFRFAPPADHRNAHQTACGGLMGVPVVGGTWSVLRNIIQAFLSIPFRESLQVQSRRQLQEVFLQAYRRFPTALFFQQSPYLRAFL